MNRPIAIHLVALFLVIGISSSSITASDTLPPNWPWRGVVVSSLAPPSAKDMRYLQQIGVNAISIHLMSRNAATRKKISGREAFKKDLKWLGTFLDECKERGITAIISIAQIPLDPEEGLTQTSPEFWDNPEHLKEAVYVAGEFARLFHSRGKEFGGYSILSEPLVIRANMKSGGSNEMPQAWPGLLKDIVKEIRRYDKTRFISVSLGRGGLPVGFAGFKPIDDPYIIYEAHMYTPHLFTHQGVGVRPLGDKYPGNIPWSSLNYWDEDALKGAFESLVQFQKVYDIPVWIGEFGAVRWAEGGDEYLYDLIGIFDSNGWGWTYHCFKCWHGWDPDYARLGVVGGSKYWRREYRGRDTMRWRLLKSAFKKNKLNGEMPR